MQWISSNSEIQLNKCKRNARKTKVPFILGKTDHGQSSFWFEYLKILTTINQFLDLLFHFLSTNFLAVNFSEWITPHRYLIHEPCFIDLLHHFNNAALTSKIWSQEGLGINRSQINKFLRFPFLNHSSIFTRRFTFAKWTMRRDTGPCMTRRRTASSIAEPGFPIGCRKNILLQTTKLNGPISVSFASAEWYLVSRPFGVNSNPSLLLQHFSSDWEGLIWQKMFTLG